MTTRTATILLTTLLAVSPAGALSENEKISRVADWSVFRDGEGDDLLCWVATRGQRGVVDLERSVAARPAGEVLVLFSAGLDEVSIELRGAPDPEGDSWLTLGGQRFALFFQDGWGWSRDREVDNDLKAGLAEGGIGTLDLGGANYRFSLDGFAAALAEAEAACRR